MKNQNILFSGQDVRKVILEQSKRANVGHIGSALSIADIIAVLYSKVLNIPSYEDENRDRFVLSKGHAALALYAALYLKGFMLKDSLDKYCADDSIVAVHPEHSLPGVEFSTGSLGQGVTFATGAALASKLRNKNNRIFVLMSDAECNEGCVWEAVMFAAHHKLSNLIIIVDDNKQQAFGYTKDVINLNPLEERFKSFGVNVVSIDGNNEKDILESLNNLNMKKGQPHVIIAHTIFGKGVSYMENKIKWHYWPMSDEEYKVALKEIEDKK